MQHNITRHKVKCKLLIHKSTVLICLAKMVLPWYIM